MMSFHDVRFPADISFKAKGGPEFRTDITVLSSGHEKRNVSWSQMRAKYSLSYKDISKKQAKQLLEFFMARRGRAYGFRFKDWNDFEAKNEVIGVGDGITKEFKLIKKYGEQDFTYERRITKPVAGSVVLYTDSADQSGLFSVDINDGNVIFSAAPESGAVISASFEFDLPVRFNTDILESETESFAKNSVAKIELIEIRGEA